MLAGFMGQVADHRKRDYTRGGLTKMNILIANDDGIHSRGIKELTAALAEVANIYVAAPHIQRSATGHGISMNEKIYAQQIEFDHAKLAFSITGTPADCVKVGLSLLQEKGIAIDMVFSGINHGGNVGTDTLYSGTVSAAIEGNICGYPAVAVSVNSHDAEYFSYACKLAVSTAKKADKRLSAKSTLSINVPNLPDEEIKGVVFPPLGLREYGEWFNACGEEGERKVYAYTGVPKTPKDIGEESDVSMIEQGYATITALNYDLTDYKLTEELKKWGI